MKVTVVFVLISVIHASFGWNFSDTAWKPSFFGDRPSSERSRIINGQIANPNSYPYQLGLEIGFSSGMSWCGASLISSNFAMTAAHCIDTANYVNVLFGAHDRTNSKEVGRLSQRVEKTNFIIHSGWNANNLRNDIALIRLTQPIGYTAQIQPIRLPTRTMHQTQTSLEGSQVIATGWGYINDNSGVTNYLRFIQVPVLKQTTCSAYFGQYVQSSNICIDGSAGKNVCFGDSGSPLATSGSTPYVLGVASFIGYQGCEGRTPSAYTRVSSYLDWISANTGIVIL